MKSIAAALLVSLVFVPMRAYGLVPPATPDPARADYDIRTATDKASAAARDAMRAAAGKRADAAGNDARAATAATALRARLPDVHFGATGANGLPSSIGIDPARGGVLAPASKAGNLQTLRRFMQASAALYGLAGGAADTLVTVADYTNPDGQLGWITLEQHVAGVPVFQGELRAGFARDGALLRTVQSLAADLDADTLDRDFGDPADAAARAARALGYPLLRGHFARLADATATGAVRFARGPFSDDVQAERMYFPLEPGVLRPAWRVLLWEPVEAWYVLVDARDGTVLWRQSITSHQSQPASFTAYPAQSPAPAVPPPTSPTPLQPPVVARVLVTPVWPAFDNLGWITDGGNLTDGNNVEAGLDLVAPDDVDAGTQATGTPYRVFDPAFTAYPDPAADPTSAAARAGAITNLFHWANVFHDRLYDLGFTEAARNFQHDNFGRGGLGGDRVSAQAQDPLANNNAAFSSPADGTRGRYQVGLATPPTPDADIAFDQDATLHEFSHGVSRRIVGNAVGLGSVQSRAVDEGWADCMALFLLAQPDDDPDAIAAIGEYLLSAALPGNQYYGIRRFPYARMASRGGAGNLPHNPLTFADFDPAQDDFTDGAFPARVGNADPTVQHNGGEIWCAALFEIHAELVAQHGFDVGNRRMLQTMVDGMKLMPLNGGFIEARDAFLAAAQAYGDSDLAWRGFATRGMGVDAAIAGTSVTESFETPRLEQTPAFTISDAACNADGNADPGERIDLLLSITNRAATAVTGASVSVNGGAPVDYGTVAPGATVTRPVPFRVPAAQVCGAPVALSLLLDGSLGSTTVQRLLPTGSQTTLEAQSFEEINIGALPDDWSQSGVPLDSEWGVTDVAPIVGARSVASTPVASGSYSTLVAESWQVPAGGAVLRFRSRHAFESRFDGGVLEVSIDGEPWLDVVTAGGSFIRGGYNEALITDSGCSATPNPLTGRNAWTGTADQTVELYLPEDANGRSVQMRWVAGSDCSIGSAPWTLDEVELLGVLQCAPTACAAEVFEDGFEAP